jgi:hypothetical protein
MTTGTVTKKLDLFKQRLGGVGRISNGGWTDASCRGPVERETEGEVWRTVWKTESAM